MMARKVANKMGPVFEFDGKLWTTGHQMDARNLDGGFLSRMYRVNPKTGKYDINVKNRLEVRWLSPTKVSVYVSNRKSMTFDVKDMGLVVPPASAKDVADDIKADEAAAAAFQKAKAQVAGVPGTPLLHVAVAVLADANFSSLARELLPLLDKQTPVDPKVVDATDDVVNALDYDVASAAAFTAHVAKLYKNNAVMAAVLKGYAKLLADEKEYELRDFYRIR